MVEGASRFDSEYYPKSVLKGVKESLSSLQDIFSLTAAPGSWEMTDAEGRSMDFQRVRAFKMLIHLTILQMYIRQDFLFPAPVMAVEQKTHLSRLTSLLERIGSSLEEYQELSSATYLEIAKTYLQELRGKTVSRYNIFLVRKYVDLAKAKFSDIDTSEEELDGYLKTIVLADKAKKDQKEKEMKARLDRFTNLASSSSSDPDSKSVPAHC